MIDYTKAIGLMRCKRDEALAAEAKMLDGAFAPDLDALEAAENEIEIYGSIILDLVRLEQREPPEAETMG